MKRLLTLATMLGALACADPLEPGTEWLAGSWSLTRRCVSASRPYCQTVDNPSAQTLTLTADGTAIVSELGQTIVFTEYRAGRDKSEAAMPSYVWFEDEVNFWREHSFFEIPGARKFALSSTRLTDSLRLSFYLASQDQSHTYLFVRTQ